MKFLKKILTILVFVIISKSLIFAQNKACINKPQTLSELEASIQKVLTKTSTPGAGVVMVAADSIVFLKGIGKADIERNLDVDENTMFRLGSVSKLFVGLAILKLQEEGRLNLKDKLVDILPNLEIVNPWESEYPIRIENLLEHTSGLNDWSLAELGSNDSKPKTLKESLEYYPKGRVARFVPGTRIQYSNLAVSIAAYIVETVSGMTYEDYVAKYFFKPMGMRNMTFRESEQYKKIGAKGYDNGVPMPYLHVLYRPSAALTGSPKELVGLLNFFINRGKIDGTPLLSESSLERMERNESLHVEKSELFNRNGLTNYASPYKSFIYRGHGGSVPGSNTDFCYLPEYNMGFAVMINDNNESVLNEISNLIKEYQTKDLVQDIAERKRSIHKSAKDLTGYYISVGAKFDCIKFLKKIKSIQKFWHQEDTLYVKSMLGAPYVYKFYSNGNKEFVSEYSDKFVIFQTNDPLEGEVINGNMGMLKKISPIYAYTLLTLFCAFLIVPVSVLIFVLLRLFIYFLGKKKDKIALWICLWPMVSTAIILVIALAIVISLQTPLDTFILLGNMSSLSILIFIGTIGFAVTSLWTVYYIFKNRNVKMSKLFYYHSALAAIFNLAFTVYFFSNGIIGLMTWI
ncbi:class A beta-lactamase-related serine hydrolase [Ancylomarina salipaludis]|uniref:Class A beta-lactamase-related serine hydrolase n=1 Tax=Ancylomarina salipaludis TaxID=2501299 RepID=A0A4Q1JML0_9BACT|nr:serine hydrolase domain-containing protein [Ancylomarina salipaludis]RXQ95818.1 class A beta-lactamase-related serine hydrolase [Ancylomarina salipaludis]